MVARRSPGTPFGAVLLLAAWVASGTAVGAEAQVEWDPELARPGDQAAYELQLRAIVRDAQSRVEARLGIALRQPPTVKVQSPAGFEREFGAEAVRAEGARIVGDVVHVNGGARLDDRFAGLVVHEMVHAALAVPGRAAALPLWLEEGLADRLMWQRRGMDDLAPSQVAELKQAGERQVLVPLPVVGRPSPAEYLRSYAAVVFLEETFGRDKVLAVVRRSRAGEPFDRALRAELGLSTADLERDFAAWVARR